MPISTSAKKVLRRDLKKKRVNFLVKKKVKQALKKVRQKPTKIALSEVASVLDRAAKKRVIHKKKASRLKSRMALLVKKASKKK